jgi:hypothetical protein
MAVAGMKIKNSLLLSAIPDYWQIPAFRQASMNIYISKPFI